MTDGNFSLIGLFAGIGGIERGFSRAGFEILGANEIDEYAAKTYKAMYKHPLVVNDIANINKEDFETSIGKEISNLTVLTGGFPCQPFSVAGYRKGFDDSRGNVFWEIHRLVSEMQPEIVFLENVKNLTSHDSGKTFKVIKDALEGLIAGPSGLKLTPGYTVMSKVLNSKDFGVPQNRERIYIVAFKDPGVANRFEFPESTSSRFNQVELSDFIDFDTKVDDKYYYGPERPMFDELTKQITDSNTVYQWRRKYVRANKSGLCPTLTANMGMGGHNVPLIKAKHGIRKLTPVECLTLMGFDDVVVPTEVAESRVYKQAGNAVVVPVIEAIAERIRQALDPR